MEGKTGGECSAPNVSKLREYDPISLVDSLGYWDAGKSIFRRFMVLMILLMTALETDVVRDRVCSAEKPPFPLRRVGLFPQVAVSTVGCLLPAIDTSLPNSDI